MRKPLLLTLIFLLSASPKIFSQVPMSMEFDGGALFPMGEIRSQEKPGNRGNMVLSPGLSYHFGTVWSLHGHITGGIASGRNETRSFETSFVEPTITVSANLLNAFGGNSRYQLRVHGGGGWLYFYSRGYLLDQRNRIKAPVPAEGVVSNTAVFNYGATLWIPLHDKIDLRLGYMQRYNIDNGWFDGYNPDRSGDHFGIAFVGLSFSLKSDVKEDEVKMDKAALQKMVKEREEAKEEAEIAKKELDEMREKLALEAMEKEEKIKDLKIEVDSLESKIRSIETMGRRTTMSGRSTTTRRADAADSKWRVVVGSFSKQENAENFVKDNLKGQGGVEIIYVQDVGLYRVIYSSHTSLQDARNAFELAKLISSDAWIVKF